jgi:hypothetical protein
MLGLLSIVEGIDAKINEVLFIGSEIPLAHIPRVNYSFNRVVTASIVRECS